MIDFKSVKQEIKNDYRKIAIVHYSCSSTEIPDIGISSICVYPINETPIVFSRLDHKTELSMLKLFWSFILRRNYVLVGWNMNNSTKFNLGIIKNRYNKLSKTKINEIPKVTDLDDLITQEYSTPGNVPEKLLKYAKINSITTRGFVNGFDELKLFDDKKFQELNSSVERKCKVVRQILNKYIDGSLKVIEYREAIKKKLFKLALKQGIKILQYKVTNHVL
ncbi:MAG: hypothetical protein WC613_04965 [Candidatus Aenigmatarchaeota archaeon]